MFDLILRLCFQHFYVNQYTCTYKVRSNLYRGDVFVPSYTTVHSYATRPLLERHVLRSQERGSMHKPLQHSTGVKAKHWVAQSLKWGKTAHLCFLRKHINILWLNGIKKKKTGSTVFKKCIFKHFFQVKIRHVMQNF